MPNASNPKNMKSRKPARRPQMPVLGDAESGPAPTLLAGKDPDPGDPTKRIQPPGGDLGDDSPSATV